MKRTFLSPVINDRSKSKHFKRRIMNINGNIYISNLESKISDKNSSPDTKHKEIVNETTSEKSVDHGGTLNPNIQILADTYAQELIRSKKDYTPIHVDEMTSRLAKFYEKIRKVIDWKDDNAIRRGSIERILKRVLFPKLAGFLIKNYDPETLAETITIELIRGGHLPNHTIPRERLGGVSEALYKYLYFFEHVSNDRSFKVKEKTNLATFILEIAACEIEEILTNPVKEQEITKAMTNILNDRISVIPSDSLNSDEKLKIIRISAQRTLYDLDDNFIIYQLLKEEYPDWHNPSPDRIGEMSNKIPDWWKNAYKKINTRINGKFDSVSEGVDTVFMLLDDVLEELKDKPNKIRSTLENKEKLTDLITKSYNKRYKTLKIRLLHLAFFSTLSVFLSNWVTFYIIEVPLAHLFYEGFNLSAAIIDFLIPTLVMFFLVIIIKPPKKENLKKIISTTLSFVYKDGGQEHYQIRIAGKRFRLFNVFMTLLFILSAWLVFTSIAFVFYVAKLPITSVIFDTFTIALTVFAAVVIRNQSKELSVDEDRNFSDFVLDILTLPIAKVGSVLAKKWREYNIVAIFFNFVIETPFVAVLDFIQGWSEYLKERRSEMH